MSREEFELWRTKLKNNLKAIHNGVRLAVLLRFVVANQVKEQFESNSQPDLANALAETSCGEPS